MRRFSKSDLEFAEEEVYQDLHDKKLRNIIGSYGGKPTLKDKIFNVVFVVLVMGLFIVEIFFRQVVGTMALDAAVLLISLKLIYLMHTQAKVNHYQFWILTALEMKTTIMLEKIQKMSEQGNEE